MAKKILVITPAFSGGSWICTEGIVDRLALDDYRVLAIGLGKIFHRDKKIKYFSIPFPRYDKWGFVTSLSAFVAFLWNIPLLVAGLLSVIFWNPQIVIYNGLASSLTIGPFANLLGKKNVVSFHGYIGENSGQKANILRLFFRFIDQIVVNSEGSKENVTPFISAKKIVVSEHFADDIFFTSTKKEEDQKLSILYVGRLDHEKLCQSLIASTERLINDSKFDFKFVGVGEYDSKIKELENKSNNVKYLGYVNNRQKLGELYSGADVTWSCADETYLAIPAIESLASGTPIIIPNVAAIPGKIEKRVRIRTELVPKEIGWQIDPFDDEKVLETLKEIQQKNLTSKMFDSCRETAKKKYSKMNLENTVDKIKKIGVANGR